MGENAANKIICSDVVVLDYGEVLDRFVKLNRKISKQHRCLVFATIAFAAFAVTTYLKIEDQAKKIDILERGNKERTETKGE